MNLVKLKNQKNGENQWEPCKIVLYSALQTYKNKIIQFPILQLNKQIISTYFVYIFSAHIRAMREIIYLVKWYQ